MLYNLTRSGVGRALRAVRDDEIAASLCGLQVGRMQTLAFVVSAACAGLGGAMLAVVLQLAQPGAFPLQLSLSLLTGVVLGGLGSLVGAIWGAALLDAAAELDQRPGALVLALDQGLGTTCRWRSTAWS